MDISRIADIGSVNQTNLTRSVEQRTENKSSSLAAEHTDKFVKSEAMFSPAYTKKSAQKQNSDNNLTQRENTENHAVEKTETDGGNGGKGELMTKGVSHIIRAMLVKQGEILSGSVPSLGAKMYAEELLNQLRALYGNSPAEENTPEYWQPEETAARLLTFFDAVNIAEGKQPMLERSFLSAFSDTEQLFGGRGRLPLESYETKQLVLDAYFNKGAA